MSNKIHKATKITVKIVHIKLTILAFVLLPIAVFTLVTSKTDKVAGIKSFVVLTGSMTPSIPQGSVIFTKKAEAYAQGDVVSFNLAGRNVTHRINAVQQDMNGDIYFETKGDANKAIDSELVSPSSVIGKSVFHMPYVGKVILFLKSVQGFIALIILPSLLFIGLELWAIKREIEKETEKKVLSRIQAAQNTQGVMGISTL